MQPRRKLDILLAGDLHGSAPGLQWLLEKVNEKNPDLLLFVGDFVTGGPDSFVRETLRDLRMLPMDCFVVPGNWDPREMLVYMDEEAYDGLRNLHKSAAFKGGYTFAGLGGSITTPSGRSPLESPDEGFADPLSVNLPAEIWVLHSPLYGQLDEVEGKEPAGSRSLKALWEEVDEKPLLVVSGHIHTAYGKARQDGTWFANAGPLSERRAAWIELRDDEVSITLIHGAN